MHALYALHTLLLHALAVIEVGKTEMTEPYLNELPAQPNTKVHSLLGGDKSQSTDRNS